MANTTGKKHGGRKKGTPNKTTQQVRDAYQMFVENNMGKFQAWIESVAKEDPHKALDIIIKISEYFVPKLARHEMVGDDGGPIEIVEIMRFSKPKKEEGNKKA